ncbi:hypothetical protein BH11VER1_BH11VER1_17030 [soil metagenome]
MAKISFLFGALLIALGVFSYGAAESKAVTALIPAFFGLVMLILGWIASRGAAANKHAMHVAAILNLLGAGAGLSRGIPNISKYLGGDHSAWLKALSQGGMGLLCLVFLVLCIRSFITARRNRLSSGAAS